MEHNQVEIDVIYRNMDEMGIVHHSQHLIWFEIARFHFAEKVLGLTFQDLQEMKITMPVSEIHCQYIRSVTYPDKVIVTSFFKPSERPILEFSYTVHRKSDGLKIATGRSVNALVLNGELQMHYPPRVAECISAAMKMYSKYFK